MALSATSTAHRGALSPSTKEQFRKILHLAKADPRAFVD